MSVVSSVSCRVLAGSIEGSLGGRLCEQNNAMLERYVAERQRYNIACGGSTSTPRQDAIREMQRKLGELVPKAMGTDQIRGEGACQSSVSGTSSALGRKEKPLVGL